MDFQLQILMQREAEEITIVTELIIHRCMKNQMY